MADKHDASSEAVAAPAPKRIIIYKKRKQKHEHHGGAWKVAFADFMTAMFALFLVLWILTQSQDVKSAVASYFRHATDYEGKPEDILRGNRGLMDHKNGRMDIPNNFLQPEDNAKDNPQEAPSTIGGFGKVAPEPGARPGAVTLRLDEDDDVRSFLKLQEEILTRLGLDPSFAKIKDNLVIETHEEGMLIQFVQQRNSPLLDAKTGAFRDAFKSTLGILAKTLGELPNVLEIDGHGSIFENLSEPSQKWQASAMMANMTRLELEKSGLKKGQVTKVAGCASTRLMNPNNVNDPVNQRISIFVRPRQWKVERY
ncbi:MAG: flagellar motor protein MotB [Planctomycetota bacterium]